MTTLTQAEVEVQTGHNGARERGGDDPGKVRPSIPRFFILPGGRAEEYFWVLVDAGKRHFTSEHHLWLGPDSRIQQ